MIVKNNGNLEIEVNGETGVNRDKIIRMAREAGMPPIEITSDKPVIYPVPDALERFAALVAAAEREKVAQWMIQHSYATGHGDTTEDLLAELDWQITERIAKFVDDEREECAKVCEGVNSTEDYYGDRVELVCAAAIRERGSND
jgi:hypothetical protein